MVLPTRRRPATRSSTVTSVACIAPDQEPVLWPEHFDLGISVAGVNYGVSPGDDGIATPYAYVGPPTPVAGAFWNQPFGAARSLRDLPDVAAVVAFFREGSERLRS